MFGKVVILILLLTCDALFAEEVQRNASDDKQGLLKKSDQKEAESSFMSKITSWIFPPKDSLASEDHHQPQYLPPPNNGGGYPKKDCNPCNAEPWIPVAANYGRNTIVGYMPQQQFNSYHHDQVTYASSIDEFRPPAPSGNFHNFGGFVGNTNSLINDGAGGNNYPLKSGEEIYPPKFPAENFLAKPPPLKLNPIIGEPTYGPPKPIYNIPKLNHPRPPKFFPGHRSPPHKYIPLKLKPSMQYNQGGHFSKGLDTNMRPPPIVQNVYPNFQQVSSIPSLPNNHPPPQFRPQNHIINPDYIPPFNNLPLSNGGENLRPIVHPIPLPNLSGLPVAPLHNPQPFRDNFQESGSKVEYQSNSNTNVEIVQSIPIANFLASVDHPINIIRSPLVEVNVANVSSNSEHDNGYYNPDQNYRDFSSGGFEPPKLSDNPIVVDDAHTAASNYSYKNEPPRFTNYDNLSGEINANFINQIVTGIKEPDYHPPSSIPFTTEISTSMQPPPVGNTFWYTTPGGRQVDSTTKRPKQIQIIIPYTTNTKGDDYNPLPLYTQPPNLESVWSQHEILRGSESKEITATTPPQTTEVINIKELFKGEMFKNNYKNLPFDIVKLQKNIDGWTEQEYANKMLIQLQKASTTTRLVPSKKIPDEYLTTLPYNENEVTTLQNYPKDFFDHEPAGTNSKEYKYNKNELETNLITDTTTALPAPTPRNIKTWDKIHIAVSPLTKEKVYVVTPQPPQINSTSRFSISIMPMRNKTDSKDVKVVLSEWPHLINNLATTTTEKTRTSRHPLFGLMDLSSYAPPENSTIQTYSGHSKVIKSFSSSTTSSSAVNKRSTNTSTIT